MVESGRGADHGAEGALAALLRGRGCRRPQRLRQLFGELDRLYGGPGRHYHAWSHIRACLDELGGARGLAAHPAALELALWYHDAIYEPGAPDNEERSAILARQAAARLGLPEELGREAEALVLATRHLGPGGGSPADAPGPADAPLMQDIDLAILGAAPEVFAAYEEGIRLEYAFVPEGQRRARRAAVLRVFLDRPRLYLTPSFHERLEGPARRNLRASLARLERPRGERQERGAGEARGSPPGR